MDRYLTTAILVVLANKALGETQKLFLQNHFGLYDSKNHKQEVESSLKIRRYYEANKGEPIPVGSGDEANSNTFLGFETIDATAPRFREKMPINPTNILQSVSGITDIKKQKEEVLKILKNKLIELSEIPNFGHELYVARALQNSTLSYKVKENGSVVTKTIDLKSPEGHIVNYSADATKKVTAVVKEGQNKVGKKYKADTLILGSDLIDTFLEEIGTKLNTRHIEGVEQQLRGLEVGQYRYHGRYDGLDVYEYVSSYKDGETDVNLINSKNVIVTSTTMKWIKYFGAIQDTKALKEGKHITKVYSKSWEEEDPSETFVLMETDSIPVPTDSRGIYCATMA